MRPTSSTSPGDGTRVVLVAGAPGVGKTTLGRAIAARHGWASFSFDDVMVVARRLTSPTTHPELHPIRRAGGHVPYFTAGPPERLIADARALEEATWPIVASIVELHRARAEPIVLDWWLLPPAEVAALDAADVASIWIHLDPDALWERERRNAEFLAGSADPDGMLRHFMRRSLWRNDLIESEATRLGLPLLRTSGREAVAELVDRAHELAWIVPPAAT